MTARGRRFWRLIEWPTRRLRSSPGWRSEAHHRIGELRDRQRSWAGACTALAYDEIHDEIVAPQPHAHAVLTFRGGANGEEPPIRVIQGPLTQLGISEPDQLAIDPVNNEIYVPQGDSVLVFSREANGNVAPIRVLKGPDALRRAAAVAIDPVHNLLLVTGTPANGGPGGVMIFDRTAQGNAKPRGMISGPKTDLGRGGRIYVYPPRGIMLVVASVGSSVSRQAGEFRGAEMAHNRDFVGVWSIHDRGDVPPRWMIGGPDGMLVQIRGVALDPKHKSVIVSDKRLNALVTYSFPEIF